MNFVDNLLMKIDIDRTAASLNWSMGPPDSGRRIDKDLARKLFAIAGYEEVRRRDLEMYRIPADASGGDRIVVLDNDLPIYQTSVEDVVLRKSPIVKEMVNIRNVIKILNDSDVLICKKDEAVDIVRRACVGTLDLSYAGSDIDGIADRGKQALSSGHTEGMQEVLVLFGELLGYIAPPKRLSFAHHDIIARREEKDGTVRFGPLVAYNRSENTLKYMESPITMGDASDLDRLQSVVGGNLAADAEGPDVFSRLQHTLTEHPYSPG